MIDRYYGELLEGFDSEIADRLTDALSRRRADGTSHESELRPAGTDSAWRYRLQIRRDIGRRYTPQGGSLSFGPPTEATM
jgi:hypothetical protein